VVIRNCFELKENLVPSLEMAIVTKCVAMTSMNRNHNKRIVDPGDFTNIIRHNRDHLNLAKLKRL